MSSCDLCNLRKVRAECEALPKEESPVEAPLNKDLSLIGLSVQGPNVLVRKIIGYLCFR